MQLFFGALLLDRIRILIQGLNSKRSQNSSASSSLYEYETPSDGRDTASIEGPDLVTSEYELTSYDEADRATHNNRKSKQRAPFSKYCEVLNEVTPELLHAVIASTLKARSAGPTQELILHGDSSVLLKRSVSARKIKKLGKACPAIKQLAVEDMNFCARGRHRYVSLEHFPATLIILSVRDSLVEMNAFLNSSQISSFINIRVLDLGGTINACGVDSEWPKMDNLEELYLEGARGLNSGDFLKNILVNCPALKTIDLEGTDVDSGVMVTLGSFAVYLENVFLGFTEARDDSFYLLGQRNLIFRFLEVLCLADTSVTQYGLSQLRRYAPKLREVTVNRNRVSEDAQRDVVLPLRVHRVCNVHIGALFRNKGCEHFKMAYSRRHTPNAAAVTRITVPTKQPA